MMRRTFCLLVVMLCVLVVEGQTINVIPYPQSVTKQSGSVPMSVLQKIEYVTSDTLSDEGYTLDITTDGVRVGYTTETGKFYAEQTLEQLRNSSTDGTLPLVSIQDKPQLAYRSFMLDCSRHFFTKEAIKRMLRIMSYYKINFFHWHLCDDQGWRVEIPEYPRLTQVGSIRKGSLTKKDSPYFYDDTEYGRGCYYTLDDLREVVRYADSLHIQIIPEYDLPGHNVAALAAYPNLSCDSTKTYEVRITEGVSSDVLNVGDDRVIDFLKCVLGHLAEVFPSKYMHLGGDECPTTVWQSNAQCQQRIKDEGLSSVDDLQPWLLEKLGSWLRDTYGKQVVAWDELVNNWKTSYTIKPIIMCYSNASYAQRAQLAAQKGLMSIITPTTPLYFDQMQCSTSTATFDEIYQGGYGSSWVNTVQDVYNFNPLSAYGSESTSYCFGTQGSLWTESCCSEAEMQYQFLPRMLAVAESGWTPIGKKNWTSFYNRLQYQDEVFDSLGYIYAKHYIKAASQTTLEKQQTEARRLLSATLADEAGYVSSATRDALAEALESCTTSTSLQSANKKYKSAAITMPTPGTLYRIRSASAYYLQRYMGASLYLKDGVQKIHYTAQSEPEELWICQQNSDNTYSFISALDGTALKVNGSTSLTISRPTTYPSNYVDYEPGVVLIQGGGQYLYANANGTVTQGTEARLGYPSSWRFESVTDYTLWTCQLQTKCQREVEAWLPATYGYRSQEAIDFLQSQVIDAIETRLKETTPVTREEYEAYVALYRQYLDMPRMSFIDAIDEDHYYYMQNAYFTSVYAYTYNTGNCVVMTGALKTTDDKFRWRFEKQQNGSVRVINKKNDRPAYLLDGAASGDKVKVIKPSATSDPAQTGYTWTLEPLTTDEGQSGVAIVDVTNALSWYNNPNSDDYVILRPKDCGASIWNFIRIDNDVTAIDDVKTVGSKITGIFDIQGRTCNNTRMRRGVYISAGKKIFIKE